MSDKSKFLTTYITAATTKLCQNWGTAGGLKRPLKLNSQLNC